jgi:hypothetical protein
MALLGDHRRIHGDVAVDVGLLVVHHALQVGHVVLEVVAVDGGDDGPGHHLRGVFGHLDGRRPVAGAIPDVGVDGTGLDEPHGDPGAVQIDGHGFRPSGEGELAGAVGRLARDTHPASHAGHVDDGSRPAGQHGRQQAQGEAHG